MAFVQPFPLLKLPFLPLSEVVSYLNAPEQMWLSMISKNIQCLVKGKQKLNLEVTNKEHTGNYETLCKDQNGTEVMTVDIFNICYQTECVFRKIDDIVVPMRLHNHSIKMFWSNGLNAWQKITAILCNTFTIESIFIKFFARNQRRIKEIIEHSHKLKSEFNSNIVKMEVSAEYMTNDSARYILQKCSNILELTLSDKYGPKQFSYKHNLINPNIENSFCILKYADWFTFQDSNLLMKCKKIKIGTVKWMTQEVNQFLKKWIEISTMEDVDLIVEYGDLQLAVEGLTVIPQNKTFMFNGIEVGPLPCFKMQRIDGTKANVWRHGRYFVMRTYQ